jgi:periplasmic divalent cation tolerance protein
LKKNLKKTTESRATVMCIAIHCNCPKLKFAKELATKLVEAKLAACVNIIPGIGSIYMWENKLVQEKEYLLIIKTTKLNYLKVEKLIKKHHPYTCPEIIAIPIEQGSPEYLTWLQQNTL